MHTLVAAFANAAIANAALADAAGAQSAEPWLTHLGDAPGGGSGVAWLA